MRSTKIIKICSFSLWTCLHHMVILTTQNKITDFLMILAWASPFNTNLHIILFLMYVRAMDKNNIHIFKMYPKLLLTTFVIQYITVHILLDLCISAIWIISLTFTSPCTCLLTATFYELTANPRHLCKGCPKRNIIVLFFDPSPVNWIWEVWRNN